MRVERGQAFAFPIGRTLADPIKQSKYFRVALQDARIFRQDIDPGGLQLDTWTGGIFHTVLHSSLNLYNA
ncbi:hypothetical protein MTP99_013560 [Tenebrio molitor]|nr:hypothetical protein MTP99_013560 [Tenebrio molitor]